MTKSKQNTKRRKQKKGKPSPPDKDDTKPDEPVPGDTAGERKPAPQLSITMGEFAEADYGGLEKTDRAKLDALTDRLKQMPNPTAGAERLKHMQGLSIWRKKVGRLRVIFTYESLTKELVIINEPLLM